jgi:predicted alpha/beta superfamily hydrolase
MTLRTELDWNKGIEPIEVSADGTTSTFRLSSRQPFLYFKPCLVDGSSSHWAVGENNLLLMTEPDRRVCYPFFFSPPDGRFSKLIELPSKILGRQHKLRGYMPPGYDENTLAHYPVIFMQDGQNLFFPEEAFMGQHWRVGESSELLRGMGAVDDCLILAIYSGDRMREYTQPGYELYGRSLAEEIVPELHAHGVRAIDDRRARSVWGSSLGGVVSFYCAWNHPDVFGSAACMSSTFSYHDDLVDRVMQERSPDVGFYLDSGWPGDNYEVTVSMAMALVSRGWRYGHNLLHFVVPLAKHNESAWAVRLHLPMQFFQGSVARAARLSDPVLGDAAYREPAGQV